MGNCDGSWMIPKRLRGASKPPANDAFTLVVDALWIAYRD